MGRHRRGPDGQHDQLPLTRLLPSLRAAKLTPMNSLLLTGGRVVDPANQFDSIADVLILDGKIYASGRGKIFADGGNFRSESTRLNSSHG